MKITNKSVNPSYGDKEHDLKYIDKGFYKISEEENLANIKNLISLFPENTRTVLDVGCGIGLYHRIWIDAGYKVTGIDISETFLENAKKRNPDAVYIQSESTNIQLQENFDVVTLIDPALRDALVIRNMVNHTRDGGMVFIEARNPNHTRSKGFTNQFRTWKYENDHYILNRQEYNYATQQMESEEITINLHDDTVTVLDMSGGSTIATLPCIIESMIAAGLNDIQFFDRGNAGSMELSDESIYKIWVRGKKL